jgi:hypothetical protein
MAIGYIQFDNLPLYIAVQVSPERWAICKRVEETGGLCNEGKEWFFPEYETYVKGLTRGSCHNMLTDLQQREREERANANPAAEG